MRHPFCAGDLFLLVTRMYNRGDWARGRVWSGVFVASYVVGEWYEEVRDLQAQVKSAPQFVAGVSELGIIRFMVRGMDKD